MNYLRMMVTQKPRRAPKMQAAGTRRGIRKGLLLASGDPDLLRQRHEQLAKTDRVEQAWQRVGDSLRSSMTSTDPRPR